MNNILKGSKIEQRHNDIKTSIVIGTAWGDEGKGKITDILAQDSDVIIRFNGGHNAGHSVKVRDKEYALHILPSGMLSEGKINMIMSSCVLGIKLNKIDLSKLQVGKNEVYSDKSLDELLLLKNGKMVSVGLISELENLEKGGINTKKSGLKISGETTVITMLDVLLDGLDEKSRIHSGLQAIGSTGSGISRSYSNRLNRLHFSLQTLLTRPDDFYSSLQALWLPYKHCFPNILFEDLIKNTKEQRQEIISYIQKGKIEIISNEKGYIKELQNKGLKIIGEGAQSTMISEENSYFGTASNPSLHEFLKVTGMVSSQIANIFGVIKMPSSSVGNRPDFMNFPASKELDNFRNKYREYGVSSGRARDLLYHSLPEVARGMYLATHGIDDESKIVPVYNRVDGIEDSLEFYPNKKLKIITGYKYKIADIVDNNQKIIKNVGIFGNQEINPENLLNNYPDKSEQLNLFDIDSYNDLHFKEISGDTNAKITKLLGYHLAAIYSSNIEKEFLIGTGPCRDDLLLKKSGPIRY